MPVHDNPNGYSWRKNEDGSVEIDVPLPSGQHLNGNGGHVQWSAAQGGYPIAIVTLPREISDVLGLTSAIDCEIRLYPVTPEEWQRRRQDRMGSIQL